MALRLYIYSGLGNVIALVDLLRNDLKLTEEDVLKISKSKNVEFILTLFTIQHLLKIIKLSTVHLFKLEI